MDYILSFIAGGLTQATWWQVVVFTLVMTHITIVSVTVFLHRSQAHRGLDLHPAVMHFFRFWLWMTTGMVTKEWVAIHRKHHAKCEKEGDPHSPILFGIWKVLFRGAELYREESNNKETMAKFGHGTPDDWLERNVYSKHSLWGVLTMLAIDVALFGAIGVTVWAVQMAWIPFWAAGVVNGIGHFWGYRNYNSPDTSTNVFPWGIVIGGEELHNNHHAHGTSAKFSAKWYEFDIGWMYIRILETFGLAKVKKVAPVPKFDRQKSVIDLDTLQSVISNRYDVTAKYARSLKTAWQDELDHLIEKAKLESRFLKSSKKLLQREPGRLEDGQKQQLSELFAHSKALQTMHEMRIELSAIWERSHSTREQLLQQLQDWCARAEASGVKALRDFALRLRSYA